MNEWLLLVIGLFIGFFLGILSFYKVLIKVIVWIVSAIAEDDKKTKKSVPYLSYYQQRKDQPNFSDIMHRLGQIRFDNEEEALDTISQMYDIIAEYKSVTVADLLALLNEPDKFGDEKYGWTDLGTLTVYKSRFLNNKGDYKIEFPKPKLLS